MMAKRNSAGTKFTLRTLLGLLSIVLTLGFVASSAQADDYVPWVWGESHCDECTLEIVSDRPALNTPKVKRFIHTLEDQKSEIQKLYGVNPQEYNLLAHMAVGILGRESLFFTSTRYRLKQTVPGAVTTLKTLRAFFQEEEKISGDVPDCAEKAKGTLDWTSKTLGNIEDLVDGKEEISDNSRGPTQIKTVPDRIAKRYGVTSDNISIPENAAEATMGFLIEALQQLKRTAKAKNLDFVTPETYADYLPYIYFGRTKDLIAGGANPELRVHPEKNAYIQDMKRYMGLVQLYEMPPNRAGSVN